MSSATSVAVPHYGLFCATWGSFSERSGLADLAQTEANAVALRTAIDSIGALKSEPTLLHDATGTACLGELERFLAAEGGDVVVYLSSHGLVPSGVNQFFRLATGETEDQGDFARTLVMAEVVQRLAGHSAGRKLLIVDACYSGKSAAALTSSGGGDLDLPEEICFLLATDSYSAALAPAGEALTAFTGSLAAMLVEGLPDRGPQLTMRSIYSELRSSAEAEGASQPWMISTGSAAETIAFRNAASAVDGDAGSAEFAELIADFDHRTEILYVDDEENLREDFREELERAPPPPSTLAISTSSSSTCCLLETIPQPTSSSSAPARRPTRCSCWSAVVRRARRRTGNGSTRSSSIRAGSTASSGSRTRPEWSLSTRTGSARPGATPFPTSTACSPPWRWSPSG
jgi:hypothetical protein